MADRSALAAKSRPSVFVDIFALPTWILCGVFVLVVSAAFLAMTLLDYVKVHPAGDPEPFGPLNSLALTLGLLGQRSFAIDTPSCSLKVEIGNFGSDMYYVHEVLDS